VVDSGRLEGADGTLLVTSNETNGGAPGSSDGAGIYNAGYLGVGLTLLTANQALNGGGGGLYNAPGAVAELARVTAALNTASHNGGGIENDGSLTVVSGSVVSSTSGANGGGIASAGALSLLNTTLSGNQAAGAGGGVWNGGQGTQRFVTLAYNTAGVGGGGLHTTSVYTTGSSIFSMNEGPDDDCGGDNVESLGYNVLHDYECGIIPLSTDQEGANPQLLPLVSLDVHYFHALPDFSPALEAGDPLDCPATDQRGTGRPIGLGCDAGAVEWAALSGYFVWVPLLVR
jgi:hypothetical protein